MGTLVLGAALRNSLWIPLGTRLLQQALSTFLRSAPGQTRSSSDVWDRSALHLIATNKRTSREIRVVPTADLMADCKKAKRIAEASGP